MERIKKCLEFLAAGAFIGGLALFLQVSRDRILDDELARSDVFIAMCLFAISGVLMVACHWWQRSIDAAREKRQRREKIVRLHDEAGCYSPHFSDKRRDVA